MLEWHYMYLKDAVCKDGTYKKCAAANHPDPNWKWTTPADKDGKKDGADGDKWYFPTPDLFECIDKTGTNGGTDAGTDTKSKVKDATDNYNTDNDAIAGLKTAYDNDVKADGAFGLATTAKDDAKKTMDEKVAANVA